MFSKSDSGWCRGFRFRQVQRFSIHTHTEVFDSDRYRGFLTYRVSSRCLKPIETGVDISKTYSNRRSGFLNIVTGVCVFRNLLKQARGFLKPIETCVEVL